MRVAVAERGGQQALRLVLLRNRREGLHRSPRRSSRVGRSVPSTVRYRVGEACGELPVRVGDAHMEAVVLALDPVALAAHARDRVVCTDLEQDRAIGHQAPDSCEVEVEHPLEPEPAGDSLVGDRRVDVAVADDGRAARERRPDQLLDVLRARGRIQRRLGPRSDVAAVQDAGRESPPRAACRRARA